MNGVATNIIHLQHKKLKYYGGALDHTQSTSDSSSAQVYLLLHASGGLQSTSCELLFRCQRACLMRTQFEC